MSYLRAPFTVFLSVLWFMGVLPAPAAGIHFTHLLKKATRTVFHIGKKAAEYHYAGPVAKSLLHGRVETLLLKPVVRQIRR